MPNNQPSAWNYTSTYQDPLRTNTTHLASGVAIQTDAPKDNHGLGETFSPTDLLSTSLATCIMTIMGIHSESRAYALAGIRANVQKTMAAQPRRVAAITIDLEVSISGAFTAHDQEMLERAARACPVAQSLHPELAKNLSFQFQRV
ncbi:OsmC family protein [Flavobacteriales bacterium]|nr:OsmC family protein [Flavobacteriales bacterium]